MSGADYDTLKALVITQRVKEAKEFVASLVDGAVNGKVNQPAAQQSAK